MRTSNILLISIIAILPALAMAQSPPNKTTIPISNQALEAPAPVVDSPVLSGTGSEVISFLTTGSNWLVAPYGIYSTGSKRGGAGIAAVSLLNDWSSAMMRLDWVDIGGKGEGFFMPSGSVQLQAPITFMGKITVTPFAFTGVATPIAGAGEKNGTPVGLFGVGGAIKIGKQFDILFDVEKWSGFKGEQLRAGFGYKF